jgi:hypothetical protein
VGSCSSATEVAAVGAVADDDEHEREFSLIFCERVYVAGSGAGGVFEFKKISIYRVVYSLKI